MRFVSIIDPEDLNAIRPSSGRATHSHLYYLTHPSTTLLRLHRQRSLRTVNSNSGCVSAAARLGYEFLPQNGRCRNYVRPHCGPGLVHTHSEDGEELICERCVTNAQSAHSRSRAVGAFVGFPVLWGVRHVIRCLVKLIFLFIFDAGAPAALRAPLASRTAYQVPRSAPRITRIRSKCLVLSVEKKKHGARLHTVIPFVTSSHAPTYAVVPRTHISRSAVVAPSLTLQVRARCRHSDARRCAPPRRPLPRSPPSRQHQPCPSSARCPTRSARSTHTRWATGRSARTCLTRSPCSKSSPPCPSRCGAAAPLFSDLPTSIPIPAPGMSACLSWHAYHLFAGSGSSGQLTRPTRHPGPPPVWTCRGLASPLE